MGEGTVTSPLKGAVVTIIKWTKGILGFWRVRNMDLSQWGEYVGNVSSISGQCLLPGISSVSQAVKALIICSE